MGEKVSEVSASEMMKIREIQCRDRSQKSLAFEERTRRARPQIASDRMLALERIRGLHNSGTRWRSLAQHRT